MPLTNRGIARRDGAFWRGQTQPVSFYLHLITSPLPTRATNTLSQLTQIANGNGYSTAGINFARNTTDFPELTEDDVANFVTVRLRDIVITASGGTMPPDFNGARAIVICDDNATVTNRDVLAWWDFPGPVVISNTQTLMIETLRFRDYSIRL